MTTAYAELAPVDSAWHASVRTTSGTSMTGRGLPFAPTNRLDIFEPETTGSGPGRRPRADHAAPSPVPPPRMGHHRWSVPTARPPRESPGIPHQTTRADAVPRPAIVTSATAAEPDDVLPETATTCADTRALPPKIAAPHAAAMVAQALIEVLAGRRDMTQLRDRCALEIYLALPDFPMLAGGREVRLVSLWTCEPSAAVTIVSAAVTTATRVRALSMKLQVRHGEWVVTALQLG